MSDCPHCEWTYDPHAACLVAMPATGQALPVVWDGTALRVAGGAEAINGRHQAAGWHIWTAHPLEPDVIILGPLQEHAPIAALNALLTAWSEQPARSLLFGPGRKARRAFREARAAS